MLAATATATASSVSVALSTSLWQAVRALPSALSTLTTACHHHSFSTSTCCPQQAQPAAAAADAPSSARAPQLPPLLAFDEVYVSARSLRPSEPPKTPAALQAQNPITAVFLHGLLGSARNWRSFTRRLAVQAAAHANRDVRVLLLDLRCHGDSAARHGFHPPHDMAAAAADVAAIIQHELLGQAPHLLVGLSLGGKVALHTLKHMVEAEEEEQAAAAAAGAVGQQQQQHLYEHAPPILPPEDAPPSSSSGPKLRGLPQQVWVLDSQPGTVPLDVDAPTSVGKILQLINSIPTPLANRQELYRLLESKGIPTAVAQWLGTSLAPGGRSSSNNNGSNSNGSSTGTNSSDQKLDWMFDIQGAAALYTSYRLSSYWDVMTRPPPGSVVHLVRGERSDRWTPHMLAQLDEAVESWQEHTAEAPEGVGQLQMHCLERAGHWLHSDNPDGLHAMMLPWFRDLHENHLQW